MPLRSFSTRELPPSRTYLPGGDAVLVLLEYRTEHIFYVEDWNMLQVLSLQSEMALKRVRPPACPPR